MSGTEYMTVISMLDGRDLNHFRNDKTPLTTRLARRMVFEGSQNSSIPEIVRYVQTMKIECRQLFPEVLSAALETRFRPKTADSGNYAS
jgi:hypothetical protein